jgi:hypothetical protein
MAAERDMNGRDFPAAMNRASRTVGKARLRMSPKEGGCQIPLLGGTGSPGIVRAAMSSAASGGRIVEPVTEEDF